MYTASDYTRRATEMTLRMKQELLKSLISQLEAVVRPKNILIYDMHLAKALAMMRKCYPYNKLSFSKRFTTSI